MPIKEKGAEGTDKRLKSQADKIVKALNEHFSKGDGH
jgi:hypothetical protein